MPDSERARTALDELIEKYKTGEDEDSRLLNDCRKSLKTLCEMNVPLGEMYGRLKEGGFRGPIDKFSRWLEREGLRARKKRETRKRKNGDDCDAQCAEGIEQRERS